MMQQNPRQRYQKLLGQTGPSLGSARGRPVLPPAMPASLVCSTRPWTRPGFCLVKLATARGVGQRVDVEQVIHNNGSTAPTPMPDHQTAQVAEAAPLGLQLYLQQEQQV